MPTSRFTSRRPGLTENESVILWSITVGWNVMSVMHVSIIFFPFFFSTLTEKKGGGGGGGGENRGGGWEKKFRSRKTNFDRSNILFDLLTSLWPWNLINITKKWTKSVSSWKSTSRKARKMSLNSGIYSDTAWMTSFALCIMMTEYELNTLLSQFLWSWSNIASDCKVEGFFFFFFFNYVYIFNRWIHRQTSTQNKYVNKI